MSNQELRQATVRALTGTALSYEGDWHALFDGAGIASGPFNGRLLAWINAQLGTSYVELNGAMYAFAIANGTPTPDSWNGMGQFTAGGNFTPLTLTGTQRAATHEVYGDSAGNWYEEALVANGVQDAGYSNASTDPTGWGFVFSSALTTSFARTGGSGSSQGVATWSGSTAGDYYYQLGAATNFAAVTADNLIGSVKLRLAAGSFTNVTNPSLVLIEYTSGGALVGAPTGNAVATLQQVQTDKTFFHQIGNGFVAGGTTAFVALAIKFTATGAFNFSLGIDNPQLEKRKWRSTFAVSTRSADVNTFTVPAAPYTLDVTADFPRFVPAGTLLEIGSGSNRITVRQANYALFLTVVSGGSTLTDTQIAALPSMMRFKLDMTVNASSIVVSVNGQAQTFAITPPVVTTGTLGNGNAGYWNSTIFVPNILSAAQTQAQLITKSLSLNNLYDDFTNRANSATLTTAWTGQSWHQSFNSATNSISGGKLIATNTGGSPFAAYLTAPLSANPRYLGAVLDWTNATTGGAAGLIAATNNFVSPTNAIHSIYTDANVVWQTIISDVVQTALATNTFINAMTKDAATKYSIVSMQNTGESAEVKVKPDGGYARLVDASLKAETGSTAVFEHFWQTGQCRPEFIAVAAS
ncbi:hypothetical protein [Bradyrhizobium sp. USDA 4452]